MDKISQRQLFFFLACVAPVGKLVLLPAQLVYASANDLLFPAAANYLLQAGAIALVMLAARSERTLPELLENTFGKIAGSAVMVCLSFFYFYAAFFPLIEQKLFVQGVFYDTLPSLLVFSPFFVLSAYLCAKPASAIGRISDMAAPVSVVAFAGLLVLSVPSADFSALNPVGAAGADGFLRGTAWSMSWFFDSALLLALIGKFRYRKGMVWKAPLCYLAGGAAVIAFLAVFYGVFSDIALRQTFAFAKIAKYFSAISVLGRIDYVFICLLSLVMVFYTALPLQAGTQALRAAFRDKGSPAIYAAAVNAVFFALAVLLNDRFLAVQETITKALFWIFPLFSCLLPAAALLLRRTPREKTA